MERIFVLINTEKTTDLNQISLTGVRSILLLWMLIDGPKTLEEIREEFINLKIMEPEHSNDILRIDLNTLRTMGCDITHATSKTNFRYVIKKHPFALNITRDEIALLRKVYKKVKDTSNILLLFKYDNLFKKLAAHVTDSEIKEELYGLSVLKNFELGTITELLEDCKENNILKLIYNTPGAKEDSRKEIAAQKLVFQNDKIYLWGYDLNKKEAVTLNIKRIKSILSRIQNSEIFKLKGTYVKFFLENFGVNNLEENEKILETRKDGFVVEGNYYNDFIAMQRILSFGSACTVLEPEEFREKIIQKLKDMRKCYND